MNGCCNLALHRAAYASSSANFIDTGHMATDGHTTTRWRSKGSGPQWLYVDLGRECAVEKIALKWNAEFASAYKIQFSNDKGPSPVTGR